MHVGNYIGLVHETEKELARVFEKIADEHGDEPDVYTTCKLLGQWSRDQADRIPPMAERYGEERNEEPEALITTLFHGPRSGGLGLVRDLHDLRLMTDEAEISWTVLYQAARALRDSDLEAICTDGLTTTERRRAWLTTRIKQAAPEALIASQ